MRFKWIGHDAPVARGRRFPFEAYGWAALAEQIPIRCFSHEPSISSSLHFLRRTPWARTKVEGLYQQHLAPKGPKRSRS